MLWFRSPSILATSCFIEQLSLWISTAVHRRGK